MQDRNALLNEYVILITCPIINENAYTVRRHEVYGASWPAATHMIRSLHASSGAVDFCAWEQDQCGRVSSRSHSFGIFYAVKAGASCPAATHMI
jgi:predicted nucleic acid-binding protein